MDFSDFVKKWRSRFPSHPFVKPEHKWHTHLLNIELTVNDGGWTEMECSETQESRRVVELCNTSATDGTGRIQTQKFLNPTRTVTITKGMMKGLNTPVVLQLNSKNTLLMETLSSITFNLDKETQRLEDEGLIDLDLEIPLPQGAQKASQVKVQVSTKVLHYRAMFSGNAALTGDVMFFSQGQEDEPCNVDVQKILDPTTSNIDDKDISDPTPQTWRVEGVVDFKIPKIQTAKLE